MARIRRWLARKLVPGLLDPPSAGEAAFVYHGGYGVVIVARITKWHLDMPHEKVDFTDFAAENVYHANAPIGHLTAEIG